MTAVFAVALALASASASAGGQSPAVVMVPLAPLAIDPADARSVDRQIRAALLARGVRLVDATTTARRLEAEAPQLIRCADGRCAAAVARVFEADEVILGSVAGYGGRRTVMLSRFDAGGGLLGSVSHVHQQPVEICDLYTAGCPTAEPPARARAAAAAPPAPGDPEAPRSAALAAAPPPSPPAAPVPTPSRSPRRWLVGGTVGVAFPQLFSVRDAGPSLVAFGAHLPWFSGRAGIGVELGATRTTRELQRSDPRLTAPITYRVDTLELSASLGAAAVIPLGPASVAGFAGVRAARAQVDVDSATLAGQREAGFHPAWTAAGALAWPIGPGAAVLQLAAVSVPIDHLIGGRVDVGHLTARAGYFFSL